MLCPESLDVYMGVRVGAGSSHILCFCFQNSACAIFFQKTALRLPELSLSALYKDQEAPGNLYLPHLKSEERRRLESFLCVL